MDKAMDKAMDKRPKISIITASYCSEKTIRDTLESVNLQTYPNIDHVMIDGASSDGTLGIISEFGKRVSHVTSERDQGIFDAYNKGLAASEGEVIGILNSDDYYANPNVIERVMQAFEDPNVDAVYADLVYVDQNDTSKIVRHWKSRPYKFGDFLKGFSPAHPTLFLRRRVYDKTGGFDPTFRYSGDYEYMLRAFHVHGVKSVYLPEVIVRMRTGGATGGSLPFIKKQNMEILRALESQNVKISKINFFFRKVVDRLVQRVRVPFLTAGF